MLMAERGEFFLAQTGQLTLDQYGTLHRAELAEPIVSYIRDYIDIEKLKG